MGLPLYLAMTEAEIRGSTRVPSDLAYMACHFSPYSTGLSNCPGYLPEGSLLILNDRTPISGHDPVRIAQELCMAAGKFSCRGILIDFQRPEEEQLHDVVRHICRNAPCRVGVSHLYALEADCAVFLPPVPPDTVLDDYFASWNGREIWLDISPEGTVISLNENGSRTEPLPLALCPDSGFTEPNLHCHYRIETDREARFTLFRTQEDLLDLIADAERKGVTLCAGLFQELRAFTKLTSA